MSSMGISELNSIKALLPQRDEIDAIQDYLNGLADAGSEVVKLGMAEKYVLALSNVPNLEQRIQIFHLGLTYQV